MSKLVHFLLLALLSASACAQWLPFQWVPFKLGEVDEKKAAIFIPVKLDGISCHMQLDTGAGFSTLYRNALPSKYSHRLKQETLSIASFEFASQTGTKTFPLMYELAKQPSENCSGSVGTIGNDLLLNSHLQLDLLNGRYRLDKGRFAPSGTQPLDYLDLEVQETPSHGSFPLVTVTLDNGEKKELIFDTGSAAMDVAIHSKNNWLKVVGLERLEDVKPMLIPRWGIQVPCYRAPIRRLLAMGSITLSAKTTALYCNDPRESRQDDDPVFGVIGLASFANTTITIDFSSKRVFIGPSPVPTPPNAPTLQSD